MRAKKRNRSCPWVICSVCSQLEEQLYSKDQWAARTTTACLNTALTRYTYHQLLFCFVWSISSASVSLSSYPNFFLRASRNICAHGSLQVRQGYTPSLPLKPIPASHCTDNNIEVRMAHPRSCPADTLRFSQGLKRPLTWAHSCMLLRWTWHRGVVNTKFIRGWGSSGSSKGAT